MLRPSPMPLGSENSGPPDPGHSPPSASDATRGREGTKYGPYTFFKELSQAPGMILAEGRDHEGGSVLLQLAPLRVAPDKATHAEREDYVHMVARATEQLAAHKDPAVLLHGVAHGLRGPELFWCLPWLDGAQRLGHAHDQVESADHLTQAATALLERTRQLHASGRLDPLLSAGGILLAPHAGVQVIGLGIHLPPEWLDEGLMTPGLLAPEERLRAEPTRSGDLWRVGVLLTELAGRLPRAPAGLVQVLERLSADSVKQRFSSPDEALIEVESLQNTYAGDRGDFEASAVDPAETPELQSVDFPALPKTAQGAPREEQPTVPSQDLPSPPPAPESVEVGANAASDLLEEDLLGQATIGMDPRSAVRSDSEVEPAPVDEEDEEEEGDLNDSLDQDTSPQFPSPIGAERKGPAARAALAKLGVDKEQATVRFPFPAPKDSEPAQEASSGVPPGRVTHVAAPSQIPEGETLLEIRRPNRGATAASVAATNIVSGAYESTDGSEFTVRDVSLEDLARADEFPTMDEVDRGAGNRNAWDRAKKDPPFDPTRNRPGAGRALPSKVAPMGPQGTLVGARLINDPTGLRQINELPGMLPPPEMGHEGSGPPLAADPLLPERRPLMAPDNSGPMPAQPHRPSTQDLLPPAMGALAAAPPPSQPMLQHGSNPPSALVAPPSLSPAPFPKPAPAASVSTAPTPARGPSRLNVVLGAIGFFVAGGLAAFFIPYLLGTHGTTDLSPGGSGAAPKTYAITPANEVLLQASPASAVVVGEADGRVLGRTPLRFLVPPDLDAAILVAAEGHEPQRVMLPVRGRIRTDLVPHSDTTPCDLELKVPQGVALNAVSAELTMNGANHTVPGAALLRDEAGSGAWLVRCPRLGGPNPQTLTPHAPVTTVNVWVVGPSNATVYIDGEEVGTTPLRTKVKTGLRKIGIEKLSATSDKTERWVPIFGDTKIRMPRPR